MRMTHLIRRCGKSEHLCDSSFRCYGRLIAYHEYTDEYGANRGILDVMDGTNGQHHDPQDHGVGHEQQDEEMASIMIPGSWCAAIRHTMHSSSATGRERGVTRSRRCLAS